MPRGDLSRYSIADLQEMTDYIYTYMVPPERRYREVITNWIDMVKDADD